jgi:hypothetical protein
MHSGREAVLALDGLPLGAQIVACAVGEDGEAFGYLFEHRKDAPDRLPFWKNLTMPRGASVSAASIVSGYDDMIVVKLPSTPEGQSHE